jgi:hypothetical protein
LPHVLGFLLLVKIMQLGPSLLGAIKLDGISHR